MNDTELKAASLRVNDIATWRLRLSPLLPWNQKLYNMFRVGRRGCKVLWQQVAGDSPTKAKDAMLNMAS